MAPNSVTEDNLSPVCDQKDLNHNECCFANEYQCSYMPAQCCDHVNQEASFSFSETSLRCRNAMQKRGTQCYHDVKQMIINAEHQIENFCHFSSLPKWMQDNDYLLFGHRPPVPSVKACIKSIFSLHTESMNIWTHAIGTLCFIVIGCQWYLDSPFPHGSYMDNFMLCVFLTMCITCLFMSTCYHTLSCHSHEVCTLFCKLDYCGISLLIAGSIVPCLYFGFYCQSDTQVYYIAMTVVLCIGSVIVSWFDKFSESQYRPLRAGVFASFAFSSIIPAVHWYVHHEHLLLQETRLLNAIRFLMLMALLYTLGVLFYALRIPERFYPGRFDVWLHSHQLFHIFVVAAALAHLQGLHLMADFRLDSSNAVCVADASSNALNSQSFFAQAFNSSTF